jgi:RNA polymerase sigma-70 factor (ECF subfamily)
MRAHHPLRRHDEVMTSPHSAPISLTTNHHDGVTDFPAASFEQDVAPLRADLIRRAMRLTGNSFDAEDLVQDTMLRAYRSFATFTPGTNAHAWVYRILKNTWINNYRAAQRRPDEVPTEELTGQLSDAAGWWSVSTESAEATWLASQPATEVQAAMAGLSERFRTVVYLADVEGYPYAAIADMMDIPVGTVMSRIHRARRQLRVELGGAARRRRLVATATATASTAAAA